jgi:pimeloyl-ACP methyl ester carboxylesterase
MGAQSKAQQVGRVGDAIVGVVADPLSGRDIRRLVTQASVFPTAEKANMIQRMLTGFGAVGVQRVLLSTEAAIGGAVPVSVVWGAADRVIPAAQAESVTGAVRYLVDGTGHMPHMERPGEVKAAIEETAARVG